MTPRELLAKTALVALWAAREAGDWALWAGQQTDGSDASASDAYAAAAEAWRLAERASAAARAAGGGR